MEDQIELVKCTPKEVYDRFEDKLLNKLPADKPEFIALLERDDIIGKETKAKLDFQDQSGRGLVASIVQVIDTLPTFSDDKFYKLLSVMKEYKNGLEILAQEIETHLNPVAVDVPFDCWAMSEYISKNRRLLDDLPCDQIRHDLLAYNIISQHDKMSEERELYHPLVYTVLNFVLPKLYHQQPKLFKTFLQIMERSGNTRLEKTTKVLGGSERIPDTIQDISTGLPDNSQVIPFLIGLKKRKLDAGYEVECQSDDIIKNGVHNRPAEYLSDEIDKIKMIKYPVISKTKPAFAIILNNIRFERLTERKGSDKDEITIHSLKEKFGGMIKFHDYTLTDLKADEIHGAFKMLATHDPNSLSDTEIDGALKLFGLDEKLSLPTIEEKKASLKFMQIDFIKYGCFMAFIMSHGDEKGIAGKDTNMVKIDILSSYFAPSQCEGLRDKPKVFFVQACRGNQLDLVTVDDTSFKAPTDDIPPDTADILYVYATPESHKATRNEKEGSLFIQTLVEVMQQTLGCYHLEEILLFVKSEMGMKTLAMMKEDKIVNVKQIVSVVSQLRGRVVFAKDYE